MSQNILSKKDINYLQLKLQIIYSFRLIPVYNIKAKQKKEMNKQNSIVSNKSNKMQSLDKIKRQDKSIVKQKNTIGQINKERIITISPMKKRFSQNSNICQNQFLVNKKKNSLRLDIKIPLKQLVLLREISQKDEAKANNNKNYVQDISQIVWDEVIPTLLEEEIAKKNHFNHIIIKQQLLANLLSKIFCMFLSPNNFESPAKSSHLNEILSKIKNIISIENMKCKIQKNKINKVSQEINISKCLGSDIQAQISLSKSLKNEIQILISNIKRLQKQKMQTINFCDQRKSQIAKLNIQIMNIQKNKQETIAQHEQSLRQLQKIKIDLSNCEKDYQKIYNFVQSQNKNKHVAAASVDYKQIEAEIYDYAALLSMNQMATDEGYKSIPMLNQCYLIDNLESALKGISKKMIQENDLSLQEKYKILRDFAFKLNHQYKRKDEQYQKQIQFKTKSIQNFVSKMKKWLGNWQLKQQYLVNLRKAFALDQSLLKKKLHQIFCEKMCRTCYLAHGKQHDSILAMYQKLEENYKMGNSFY